MELIELKRKIIDAYSGPRDGLEELLEIIEKGIYAPQIYKRN